MRKENKRMLAVVLSAVCVLTAAGMDGSISVASTETRQTDSIEKTQTISSALASALEQIPEVAAVAVSTQEWHQKAVSNVDGETDVLLAGEEGSEVVGKLYHNTIVDVEEKGVVWTRVSADEVNGYVKSDSLAFGTDAVRRADQVCPVVEKPMEDNGAIVRTRESEPAKTLAQIEEEQRAAAQAAEEARKAEEAKKKAEEEAKRKAEEEARKKAEKETAKTHYENEYFSVDVPVEWIGAWSVTEEDNSLGKIHSTIYTFSYDPENDYGGGAMIYVLDMSDTSIPLPTYASMIPSECKEIGVTSFGYYDVFKTEAGAGFFFDGGATITLK